MRKNCQQSLIYEPHHVPPESQKGLCPAEGLFLPLRSHRRGFDKGPERYKGLVAAAGVIFPAWCFRLIYYYWFVRFTDFPPYLTSIFRFSGMPWLASTGSHVFFTNFAALTRIFCQIRHIFNHMSSFICTHMPFNLSIHWRTNFSFICRGLFPTSGATVQCAACVHRHCVPYRVDAGYARAPCLRRCCVIPSFFLPGKLASTSVLSELASSEVFVIPCHPMGEAGVGMNAFIRGRIIGTVLH